MSRLSPSLDGASKQGRFAGMLIHTTIEPLGPWYLAEDYHRLPHTPTMLHAEAALSEKYFEKNF